jgi:transmembrane sensor
MHPTDELDLDLLERYFAGDANPADVERLERWIAADVDRREVVGALRRLWESGEARARTWDVPEMWQQLAGRVHASPPGESPDDRWQGKLARFAAFRREPRRYRRVLEVAAAVVIIVTSAAVWRLAVQSPPADATSRPMREFATARGERAEIRLTDATRVVLGPATALRIPPDFGGITRTVFLDGEAFFDVTHDARRPFTVHAAGAVARDLGTKFTVSTYRERGRIQVVVAEGLVELQADSTSSAARAVLRPHDVGRVTLAGKTAVTRGVDLDQYLDWTTGKLVFEDASLREALPRIERWYDVTISLADTALLERRLTATFKDQPLVQVLDALTLLLGTNSFTASGRALHERTDSRRAYP